LADAISTETLILLYAEIPKSKQLRYHSMRWLYNLLCNITDEAVKLSVISYCKTKKAMEWLGAVIAKPTTKESSIEILNFGILLLYIGAKLAISEEDECSLYTKLSECICSVKEFNGSIECIVLF
jgi:hypothetical protein